MGLANQLIRTEQRLLNPSWLMNVGNILSNIVGDYHNPLAGNPVLNQPGKNHGMNCWVLDAAHLRQFSGTPCYGLIYGVVLTGLLIPPSNFSYEMGRTWATVQIASQHFFVQTGGVVPPILYLESFCS